MVIAFDLDDTLYHEMEYVRSAYRAIAHEYGRHLLPRMMCAPTPAEAFGSTGIDIGEILKIYRTHTPDIKLPMASLYTLVHLKKRGHTLALVTDGRAVTQGHKIDALGLDKLIAPDLIYISEVFGEEKLSGGALKDIMNKCPGEKYMYVGDNPAKDFVRGNELGWETVCLKATMDNIFVQDFDNLDIEYHPQKKIVNLYEIISAVDG